MKIAFWSIANEKCNVSANLAAISVASVNRYPYSVVVLENRLNNLNLGKAYMGNTSVSLLNEVGTNYYDGGGIEGLLRKIHRGAICTEVLKLHLTEIIHDHLYYIPQSRVIHSELFDYEFNHCIQTLFRLIEENSDICFIDTASSNNLSTKTILDESDLIVVNLCQDQKVLDEFFQNYSSLIPKSVFIISNYDTRAFLRRKRIAQIYEIATEDIIIIPKNISYQLAYSAGSVVEFISSNYSCLRETPDFLFLNSIKKASYIILKKAANLIKQKELSLYSGFFIKLSVLYSISDYWVIA